MNAYIYILILAILNCFVPIKRQKTTSSILLFIMMLMCGFRAYDVGTDTVNYVAYQEASFISDYTWGPLYIVLKLIASLFPYEGTVFLMLMALLTYCPLIYLSRKYSVFPGLSVLMYIIPCGIFFNESFNIARQSIGIVYILLAAVALQNKKRELSYGLTLLAFFFHPFVIFFVFIFFLMKRPFTKKFVRCLLLITMILGLCGTLTGIDSILNSMAAIFAGSSSDLLLKFTKYGNGYDIQSGFSLVGQLSHMLPMVALCWIGSNKRTKNNIYFKMMVCGSAITNLLVSVIFCERFASTFTLAQFLAVPLIYKTSGKINKIILKIILLATGMLYVYNLYQSSKDVDLWTPYHTIFN